MDKDRKRADVDPRDKEHRLGALAAIIESSDDAIISTTLDLIVTSWNKAAERMFGYGAGEIIGRSVLMLAPPGRENAMAEIVTRISRGERLAHYETQRRRKDGALLDVSLTESPIYDRHGKLIGVSKIARDITERNRAQAALRASEARLQELNAELLHVSRVSAMGQLASSIAHELNQPLTAVANYTEAARQMATTSGAAALPRIVDLMGKAGIQAERAGQIIRRLRGLVEKGSVERGPENLNDVVEEASALAAVGARLEGVEVVHHFARDLPALPMSKVQVQQVVVNLVRNAIESLRTADRRLLTIETERRDNGDQAVAVIDTGPGLAPEIAARLFQPFATTKSGGMGIGLSISQSIVEAHGGRIWHEPNPGGGAVFRFTLAPA